MGIASSGFLDKPITDIESETGQGKHVKYAVSSMQGWRSGMEDSHSVVLNFTKNASLFAVYDGHGGAEVARYAGDQLYKVIKARDEFKSGELAMALKQGFIEFDQHLLGEAGQKKLREIQKTYEAARRKTVQEHSQAGAADDSEGEERDDGSSSGDDEELTEKDKEQISILKQQVLAQFGIGAEAAQEILADDGSDEEEGSTDSDDSDYDAKDTDFGDACFGIDCGTTALMAVLEGNTLTVANAGDCRAVLSRQGVATDLSTDHSPELESEKERIYKAGSIIEEGRVDGGLNLCRALGDHNYKRNRDLKPEQQAISPSPDVVQVTLQPDLDSFLVLACDGIWNSMSSQEVVDYIQERLPKKGKANGKQLEKIAAEMFNEIVAEDLEGDGYGTDNMTMIIIAFSDLPIPKTPSKRGNAPATPSRLLRPRKLVKQELQ